MDTYGVTKRQLIVYRLAMFSLLLSAAFLVVLGAWLLYPYKTLEIKSPIVITNQPIEAGTNAYYKVEQCRYTDEFAKTSRRLVTFESFQSDTTDVTTDRTVYIPLGSSDSRAPAGCHVFSPPPVLIPIDTVPGKYRIEFEISFQVNPVRSVTQKFYSEPFDVIANKAVQ